MTTHRRRPVHYQWTAEDEAEAVDRWETAEATRKVLVAQEALIKSAFDLRWEMFVHMVARRVASIVALGGDEGITRAQLFEVYTPPPVMPNWKPTQPIDLMVRHGVLERRKELRPNKSGVDQPQIVYRLLDMTALDELTRSLEAWQADLEEKGLRADWPSFEGD